MFQPVDIENREDPIVAIVLPGGLVSVMVLGVSHDLRDYVKRPAPDAELITVRVESVPTLFVK